MLDCTAMGNDKTRESAARDSQKRIKRARMYVGR